MSDEVKSRLDWIVSYPKSGNTWARMLLSAYYATSPHDVRFEIDLGGYLFGVASTVDTRDMDMAQQVQCRGAALLAMAHRNRGARTLVKSHHMNGAMFGVPLFSPLWTQRVIYLVRDPRDVCPSWAHHCGDPVEEIARDMNDPTTGIRSEDRGIHHVGSWSGHVHSWTTEDRVDVLTVRFEDMKEDTGRELRRMVEHLGLDEVDEERIERSVEATDFQKLKKVEQEVEFPEATDHGEFFRKGKAGGWREELPTDVVERIERDHAEQMRELGYEPELVGV